MTARGASCTSRGMANIIGEKSKVVRVIVQLNEEDGKVLDFFARHWRTHRSGVLRRLLVESWQETRLPFGGRFKGQGLNGPVDE